MKSIRILENIAIDFDDEEEDYDEDVEQREISKSPGKNEEGLSFFNGSRRNSMVSHVNDLNGEETYKVGSLKPLRGGVKKKSSSRLFERLL
jgi:hypothetical protein